MRAMTVIELLVTIAVMSVVALALTSLIQSFYKDNDFLIEETAALASSRHGVDSTISALREATYGDDGSYPIIVAGTSTMTLYSDIDQDSGVEKIQFKLIGTTLYEYITNSTGSPPSYSLNPQSTSTIATNVRNTSATPIFSYYDDSGVQLSTTSPAIASISSVRVQVLVDLNPNRAPNVFTLSETATLRNLIDH
jgi:type II secretory pathway pseudopilin PulG